MRVLVTGGAGFIGSAVVRHLVLEKGYDVLNVDKLTYAGTLTSLKSVEANPLYRFLQADICDGQAIASAFASFKP
ncbi:NAD-dependent epimerase/dehydratase family protein, partial [Agrobacterium vitis]